MAGPRRGDRWVGAAFRTPPHNLVLARPADEPAIDALAGGIDAELPGVVGAVPEIDAFAARLGRAARPRGHARVRPADLRTQAGVPAPRCAGGHARRGRR